MKYFIANLSAHAVVTLILVALIVVFANRNKRGKTKHKITYFAPFIFCVLAALYLGFFTAPRLMDIMDVINEKYYSYTGYIEEISPVNNYIVIDGTTYYINPMRELPSEGDYVRVRYTPYCHYAIEVAGAESVNVDDSVIEEMQTANLN